MAISNISPNTEYRHGSFLGLTGKNTGNSGLGTTNTSLYGNNQTWKGFTVPPNNGTGELSPVKNYRYGQRLDVKSGTTSPVDSRENMSTADKMEEILNSGILTATHQARDEKPQLDFKA